MPEENGQAAENPELKAVEDAVKVQTKKKELAQLEKDTVELQRQAAGAGAPAPTEKVLEGTTTIGEGAGLLAELVAYQSMRPAAAEAGREICTRLPKEPENVHILIVDTLDLGGEYALLELTNAQLQRISGGLKAQLLANETLLSATAPVESAQLQLTPTPKSGVGVEGQPRALAAAAMVATAFAALPVALGTASTAVTALATLVGAASGVAAWFRNNYDIKSRTVAIKQRTAMTLIAHAIPTYAVYIAGFMPGSQSDLLAALSALMGDRLALDERAALLSARAKTLADEALKTALQTAATTSATLATTADEFIKGLITSPAAGTEPMLNRLLVAEQVGADRYTHYLSVQVETSGGETVTEKSLWNSGRLTYVGGGVLSYVLAERGGRVVAADAVPIFSEMTMRKGKEATALVEVPLAALKGKQ